ncbi:hypothetical protein [Thalassotalea mangrovi]|uniref:DUF4124 domain-containing protein n=1 Tax=Thalassotalea mangrovi TaxID=2572245 RepID=A0A4U1B8D8_9GAMM|nr:hypothetical protein [Thalassotalea mangrovi]TKB46285.1 hypothetical protein E8M12_04325 [Thalassotalea mangrovi]
MKTWINLLLLTSLPFAATATNDIDPLLWGCSEISDDSKRLACFDAYLKQKSQQPSVPAKSTEPEVDNVANDAVVPVSPQPTRQQVEQQFGLEHKKTEAEQEVSEISSTLAKVQERAHNAWSFTLDNGQQWQTVESTSTRFKKGQEVIIKRGMFNSFSLKKADSNRTVKVKRID